MYSINCYIIIIDCYIITINCCIILIVDFVGLFFQSENETKNETSPRPTRAITYQTRFELKASEGLKRREKSSAVPDAQKRNAAKMGKIYQVVVHGLKGEKVTIDLCNTEEQMQNMTVKQLKLKILDKIPANMGMHVLLQSVVKLWLPCILGRVYRLRRN